MSGLQITPSEEESTRTRDEDVDDATRELFTMADTIREDGYYDVPIIGWEKEKGGRYDDDQVHVTFETPIDGEHTNTYEWPTKPTEDSQFVQILMAALEVDDPVAAVSRADALKQPDGDALRSTVPCNSENGWNLKPSVADVHSDDSSNTSGGKANQTTRVDMLTTAIMAPFMVVWFILHGCFGWVSQRAGNNKHDTAKIAAATMLGMIPWSIIFIGLIALAI